MVVAAGLTLALALLHETVPTPLLIEQLVALVIPLHDSVEKPPGLIVVGLAVNESTVGAATADEGADVGMIVGVDELLLQADARITSRMTHPRLNIGISFSPMDRVTA